MNFLAGAFAVRDGVPCFDAAGLSIPLDGYAFDGRPQEGASIELGIRPEHVVAGGDLPATVEMVEPMGSDQLAWLRLGSHALSMRLPAEAQIAVTQSISLRLPPDRLNLFDARSGCRL
jgi:multiple sugar transport system ATP-binding protein